MIQNRIVKDDNQIEGLEELSGKERMRLDELEETIEKGVQSFVKVGNALAEIRDAKLFREEHKSFEAYCQHKFGWGSRRAYQLIEAAAVVTEPEQSANNCSQNGSGTPKNEGQARALADVPAADRKQVMAEASKDGKPTAKKIKAAAEKIAEQKAADKPPATKVVKSERGETVPERLHWAFEDHSIFATIDSNIRALKKQIKELAEKPIGTFIHFQSVDVDLKNLKHAISFARPHAMCPECGGSTKGCDWCRKQGFVPKDVYDRAVAAQKA